jgi:hypothetical protein
MAQSRPSAVQRVRCIYIAKGGRDTIGAAARGGSGVVGLCHEDFALDCEAFLAERR